MNQLLLITVGVVILGIIAQLLQRPKDDTVTKGSYGKPQLTLSGEVVRSYGEKAIADFLHSNGIAYQYEPRIHGLRPDFYLGKKTIIEYWGMASTKGSDGTAYRKHMNKKLRIYRKHKMTVISIFEADIRTGNYRQIIANNVPMIR